jgi:hypothetical protein
MYTREQIIEEIRRIAVKKGVQNLSQEDFERYSMVPMSTVRYYLGTWKQGLQEAGLGAVVVPDTITKDIPENEDELLIDLIRLYNETGEIPTPALIESRGKYYPRHYLDRWKSISEAYLQAQKKSLPQRASFQQRLESFPSTPCIEPVEMSVQKAVPQTLPEDFGESLRFMTEPPMASAETSMESLEMMDSQEFEEKPFCFRGLNNAPQNKIGVIYIFGMIHRELGFFITTFMPGFPDCKGERCVDRPNNRWEPVSIHFEYRSSDFQFYGRGASMNDVLVCWFHDQPQCSLEVLELCTAITQLPSR